MHHVFVLRRILVPRLNIHECRGKIYIALPYTLLAQLQGAGQRSMEIEQFRRNHEQKPIQSLHKGTKY